MTLQLHADDLGLSRGINAGILSSVDRGFVTSVSVMVNGHALEDAVAAIAARPALRVSVHLNLLEGMPLAPLREVPDLVGADGRLSASFFRLTSLWAARGPAGRARLRDQLCCEIGAQLGHARRLLGERLSPLRVDGHTHVHALPFVAEALFDVLPADVPAVVRVPAEPARLLRGSDAGSVPASGYVKHALLRALGGRLRGRLEARGIASAGAFLGVLHTGRMTPECIAAGVAALPESARGDGEVLLHPGGALPEEAPLWHGRPELWRYYRSSWRAKERETACDARVGALLGVERGAAGIGCDMQPD